MAERISASEKRLMEKLDELTGQMREQAEQIKQLNNALAGSDREPGFFERVRRLEGWTESQKRAAWLVGGLIVTDIGTRILAFINTAPK